MNSTWVGRLCGLRFSVPLMLSYVIMLMAPEMVQLNTLRWWDPLVAVGSNVVLYAALAWMVCLAAALAGRWGRAVHVVAHVAVAAYAVSTLFIALLFHRHWDAFTMQFVHETSWREAGEFAATYIVSWRAAAVMAVAALYFVAEWWACRHMARRRLVPRRWVARGVLAVAIAVTVGSAVFFGLDAERNYDLAARLHSPIKRNALWNMWQSCLQYGEFRAEFARCASVQRAYRERAWCGERDADVVFIIGESFCRHMSNLYDGRYNTNGLLLGRQRRGREAALRGDSTVGRLYVFADAVATDNGTTQNFKYFMSTASVGQRGVAWCDRPLFPAVLRRCGYNVVFYSNQFAPNDNLGQWDASMGFVNHPGIEPYIFSHRNERKYAYDMDLVADYAAHRRQLEAGGRNMCIFHLYGQHVNFAERYPRTFGRFTASDVSDRYQMGHSAARLDAAQRADVATYLNATAYNDMVVDSIMRMFDSRNAVVVYFSDHGEEVHNFRRQYGRTDLASDCREAMRCQLDVPLMVYLTPRYLRLHPGVDRRMAAATGRRVSTDNLPHLLFDMLGVRSACYDATRSVINARYREPKRILLQNGRTY